MKPFALDCARILALAATWLVACGTSSTPPASGADSSASGGDDAGDDAPRAGQDASVVVFHRQPVYWTKTDNKQTVEATASFPSDGDYQTITLHLALDCPTGGCDPWDRFGTLGVVQKGAGDGGADLVIEIARFITPFGVGGKWDVDLTALRPLLAGDVAMRGFITTYVGPGSPYGGGWLLSASFDMTGGIPDRDPIAVVPAWDRRDVPYGDPATPIAQSAPPMAIALPSGASSYEVRALVTGHGQGNADDCSEFCEKTHTLTVGSAAHTAKIWKGDCAKNPIKNQQGTWDLPRAGWCPGETVAPWTFDATSDVAGATGATIAYAVEDYTNTCRPGAGPDGGTCDNCTLGTGCAYDGGMHTPPRWTVSAVLVAYR